MYALELCVGSVTAIACARWTIGRQSSRRTSATRSGGQARALAALVIHIALINTWNRINVTTRQIAGSVPR
jgi:alkylhydroperoxidase family enzyme